MGSCRNATIARHTSSCFRITSAHLRHRGCTVVTTRDYLYQVEISTGPTGSINSAAHQRSINQLARYNGISLEDASDFAGSLVESDSTIIELGVWLYLRPPHLTQRNIFYATVKQAIDTHKWARLTQNPHTAKQPLHQLRQRLAQKQPQ